MAITLLLATALLPSITLGQGRDTRTAHVQNVISLGFGTEKMGTEGGYVATLAYHQRIGKLFIGLQGRGELWSSPKLEQPGCGGGMDAVLSWRWDTTAFYCHPQILGGVGLVTHNAIMMSETGVEVQRQLLHLAPEVGAKIEIGFKLQSVGIGIYAAYMWQFGSFTPTVVDKMTVEEEWMTHSPFTAGINLTFGIDRGRVHSGGNNLPLVEVLGGYGTRGWETGAKLVFQQNKGKPWQRKNEEGLRSEHVMSSHYGAYFACQGGLITAQFGYGYFIHPKGSKSKSTYRAMLWLGLGELGTVAETSAGEGVNSSFGVVQATPKASLEASYILRPFKNRRIGFSATLRGDYSYQPDVKTAGESTLVRQDKEKPFSAEFLLGAILAL